LSPTPKSVKIAISGWTLDSRPMIRLYLDEDVPEAVAVALRLRGCDAITTHDAGNKGLTDKHQLSYAAIEGRTFFTHNIADFAKLHREFVLAGNDHSGIILSKQLPIGTITLALLKLLGTIRPREANNRLIWLSDWISSSQPHSAR